jgi:hypothetical protein
VKAIDNALYSKFTGDVGAGGLNTLVSGWFRIKAPDGQAFPYGIYQQVSAIDVYTLPARNHRRLVYLCKAVDQGLSSAAAATIADRLDAQLTDQALTVSGFTVIYCRRTGDIEYVEVDGDQKYQHVGLLLEMLVVPA